MKYKKLRNEDMPVTAAGHGQVAGIGIGPDGEPGVNANNQPKTSIFAGKKCFEVDDNTFYACKNGKRKYAHYRTYVGEDETGKTIRNYGRSNPNAPIIIKNSKTGAMMYLKYGSM